MFDLHDQLYGAVFQGGLNSTEALYVAPGAADSEGLPLRVLISSRDDTSDLMGGEADLIRQVTRIETRLRDYAEQGAPPPVRDGVFIIQAPGHELDQARYEIDSDPVFADAVRKVLLCQVSPPDPDA